MSVFIDHQLGVSKNGFTSEGIAHTCYNLWSNMVNVQTAWENADHQAWDRVATMAIRMVDDWIEQGSSISFADFALSLFALHYGPEAVNEWPGLSKPHKLAWETVGRHIVNCLDAEAGSIDTNDLERRSIGWFNKRKEIL